MFGVSFVTLSASTQDAKAQSRVQICRSINAQLASLSSGRSGGGNSSQYRKFDNAIKKQRTQLGKTKRIAKRGRCTGFGVFNSKSSQCKRVISSIKKMEANLRSLGNQRAKFAPRQANTSSKRNQLLRDLKRNRCGSSTASTTRTVKTTKPKRKTLLEQVFGVKTYNENGQRNDNNQQNESQKSPFAGLNTYRTLCVRKTDGYYFPISFSTVKDRFTKDQATCQAMCPTANVELYHHKMPSEDSEDMVNYRTGTPYSKEPFAFAYRKSVDLEQKCRFATENRVQSVELEAEKNGKPSASTRIGTPVFRQDPALSPDDHDIETGYLTMIKSVAYLQKENSSEQNSAEQLLAENRRVRIVGPAFFPVQ